MICGTDARFRYEVTADQQRRALAALYEDPAVLAIGMADYRMFRCQACELEFANPPTPGSQQFYDWIVAHEAYYPTDRWEWSQVRQIVQSLAAGRSEPLTLIDVGCGAGDFLNVLRDVPNVRGIGLDFTADSVKACRDRGIEAYCTDLQHARDSIAGVIDVVTAFHCLEHVPDPLGFICQARDLLGPGGRLLISTPYSPMSFEGTWFDPLNHPPHHLTRWKSEPYRALAARAGMQVMLMPGPARSLPKRTLGAFLLQAGLGPSASLRRTPAAVFFAALRHPIMLLGQILRQARRQRVDGLPAPDVIMAEFTALPASASRRE